VCSALHAIFLSQDIASAKAFLGEMTTNCSKIKEIRQEVASHLATYTLFLITHCIYECNELLRLAIETSCLSGGGPDSLGTGGRRDLRLTEQHICSQGDRQVPGNIRVVLTFNPLIPVGAAPLGEGATITTRKHRPPPSNQTRPRDKLRCPAP
jgi:hypothetical protein